MLCNCVEGLHFSTFHFPSDNGFKQLFDLFKTVQEVNPHPIGKRWRERQCVPTQILHIFLSRA